MNKRFPLFATSALALLLAMSAPTLAGDPQPSKLDEMLNEDAVKALLDEASPDAAFLTRVKMMRAHLQASEDLSRRNDFEEALKHVKHPRSEIYPEIEAALLKYNMTEIGKLLDNLEASFASGQAEPSRAALQAVYAELDRAEAVIDPAVLASGRIQVEAASMLLRSAVVEYHAAFEFSKLSNMVEYHDGAYFVTEARKLLAQAEPSFEKQNAGNLSKMKESFAKLEQAWPAEAPPAELIMPVTKMQALVSIIELQLTRLQ